MSKNQPISTTYKGITYPSINAAGRAFGLSPGCVNKRIQLGVPLEAPVLTPSQSGQLVTKHRKWIPPSRGKNLSTDQGEVLIRRILNGIKS